ncbi:MAG: hypothetical protein ACXAB4_13875, partial [Candidatus Hodarchaeales archaeon]
FVRRAQIPELIMCLHFHPFATIIIRIRQHFSAKDNEDRLSRATYSIFWLKCYCHYLFGDDERCITGYWC